MTMTPTMRRLQNTRTTLLLDHPFFGVLALQAKLIEDDSIKTACTNGHDIRFNPAFVETLSNAQLLGVFAHEVMHCACGHPWRRDGRDMARANKAADYAINPIIVDAGMELPPGCLNDPQYAGKSFEWIYDRLAEDGNDDTQGNDPAGTGGFEDAPANDPADAGALTEADWKQVAAQAARMAQAMGNLPASMARAIGEATRQRTDWRSVLRRFVQEVSKADYSWSRPNVRYVQHGVFLPSLYSQECGKLVIAVDTSGSIDDVTLAQFGAEVDSIASEVKPREVDVIYCDASVNHVDTYTRDEPIKLTAHGGGGTAFGPVFDHVEQSGESPVALVYLTDLYGSFPDVVPDYPVLWASISGERGVPFGEVVAVE